ncbi:MAG: hypothetical protein IJG45_07255 [Oscillospiraceae bacterium]|nr:hypothetical protein [Oscillospiraceae bacterium]
MDYVLSHAAPREIIRRMGHSPGDHDLELTGFLEWVMYQTEYKAWFFGHWHTDRKIYEKFRALYYEVIRIDG